MSASWIKPVEAAGIVDGKNYFIAVRPTNPNPLFRQYIFQSIDIKGRNCWSSKPGIAEWVKGSNHLRDILTRRPDLVAVEVPDNAHKRWKRRQPRHGW